VRLESLVEVVGVGALNWDRLFRVDRIARTGEEIVIKGFEEEAGGSAANTIAALGRLGVECGFVGKVGLDREGERIITSFKRDSVSTEHIFRVQGRSGNVLAFVDDTGERNMYVNPGVNYDLLLKELNSRYLQSSKIIHISSFAGETSIETIKKIPKFRGKAFLSFSPGFLCWRGIDFLIPLLKECAILFLNQKEALALTGNNPSRAGVLLRNVGVERAVITLGEKGCLVVDGDGVQEVMGEKVKVVDTTGAGDAFSAGYLFGILKGLNVETCARIGNFVASKCVQQVGARKGLPERSSVDNFLKRL
jgi:ribokinase